jgi:hypothetical protein
LDEQEEKDAIGDPINGVALHHPLSVISKLTKSGMVS